MYHIEKNTVQETLIIPLYGRKVCSEHFPDLFKDPEAERICSMLDYDFEETLASFNKEVSGLETIYIRAGDIGPINSTIIMDLYRNKADLNKFLPKEIIEVL